MTNNHVRVRFAPSPTGMMHLGNVRTALMNYLFAQQKNGTFIIRIEDTDFERNFDPQATQILDDLSWLGLVHNEGPIHGGPHAPYFQSQRTVMYQQKLHEFEQKNLVYRCFCSQEELEKKRQRQLALKQPPRYDRSCYKLSSDVIQEYVQAQKPFIWRFKLNQDEAVAVTDLAHGTINFDMKSFSDIPLTRQDGSFTFMFANFVDDVLMNITHVIRGEDHLSNTAGQVAMYHASGMTIPVFWHLPILCNAEGKKLSKRDFGFSLNDLRAAGFLPEALDNYLAIIGGSFEQEIMTLQELAQTMNFEHLNATSQIKYDVEKLKWLNHKWIARCDAERLATLCKPYLDAVYPEAAKLSAQTLTYLINAVRTDLVTLQDCVSALEFYFKRPELSKKMVALVADMELTTIAQCVEQALPTITQPELFMKMVKQECTQRAIQPKTLFVVLRIALTGKPHGLGINELIAMLGIEEAEQRLKALAQLA